MPSPLTNTELAILGLVAERPKHGYQIEQDIEARGMRDWSEIGFSSIYYVLNKLEKDGWLASEVQVDAGSDETEAAAGPARSTRSKGARVGGPARRVYHLTESGWGVYREAVRQRLAQPRSRSGDLDLALANLPALPPAESRAALEQYRDHLHQNLERVRAKWQSDREHAHGFFPPHVDTLFEHSLALMRAELDWLEGYLRGK